MRSFCNHFSIHLTLVALLTQTSFAQETLKLKSTPVLSHYAGDGVARPITQIVVDSKERFAFLRADDRIVALDLRNSCIVNSVSLVGNRRILATLRGSEVGVINLICNDGCEYVWKPTNASLSLLRKKVWNEQDRWESSCAPDGVHVLTQAEKPQLYLWSETKGPLKDRFELSMDSITCALYSQSHSRVFVYGTLKVPIAPMHFRVVPSFSIVDTKTGNVLSKHCDHQSHIYSMVVSSNRQYLASGCAMGHVIMYDCNDMSKSWTNEGHGMVRCLAFSSDSRFLAIGRGDGTGSGSLEIWNLKGNKLVDKIKFVRDEPTSAHFVLDQTYLLVGTQHSWCYYYEFDPSVRK